jgi:hypothetical protein
MILGGLSGFLSTLFFHPIYESKAVITSTLDYGVLGKLDDWEEDQLYLAIGDIITSSGVKASIVEKANANGIKIPANDIEEQFTANRQDTRWVMRVRNSDPVMAQKLNQYWTEASVAALVSMKEMNSTSLVFQQKLNSLAACFEESVVVEPISSSCSIQNLDQIRAEMADAAAFPDLMDFRSSLIISHASFQLTTEPTLPSAPVLYRRNFVVLAGAMIGLFFGVILFTVGWPRVKKASA